MKRLLLGLAGTLVVLLAAVLVAPSFIDWNAYKPDIRKAVRAATGRDLVIAGDISLDLLPAPALSASDVRFADMPGADAGHLLTIRALRVDAALLPLLQGRIIAESVTLIRPRLALEILPDGRPNWEIPALTGALVPDAGGEAGSGRIRLEAVRIVDGEVTWPTAPSAAADAGDTPGIGALSGELVLDDAGQTASLTATFRLGDQPMTLEASAGTDGSSARRPVRAALTAADGTLRLAVQGSLAANGRPPRFTGRFEASGPDLARAGALVGDIARRPVALPVTPGFAFDLSGDVEANTDSATVSGLEIGFGADRISGRAALSFQDRPRGEVALAFTRLDLDPWLTGSGSDAAPGDRRGAGGALPPRLPRHLEMPDGIDVTFSLDGDAVSAAGGLIRNVAVNGGLRRGELVISHMSALLPGPAEISLEAALTGGADEPRVDGHVELASDNPRALFDWLGVEPGSVAAQRLWALTASGSVVATPDELQVSGIRLRLDTTTITGGVTFALRDRLAFGLSLGIDRLVLDELLAFLPEEPQPAAGSDPAAAQAAPAPAPDHDLDRLLGVLRSFDANVQARVGELLHRGVRLTDIALDATVQSGTITLRQARAGGADGMSATVTGTIDLTDQGSGDLSLEATVPDPPALLPLFGVSPPPALSRLGKVSLSGTLVGDPGLFTVEAKAEAMGGKAGVEGTVSLSRGPARFDLGLTLDHPSAAELLATLSPGTTTSADLGAVSGTAKLKGDVGGAETHLAVAALGGRVTIDGHTGPLGTDTRLAGQATASHPSLTALLGRLLRGYRPAAGEVGPVEIAADLTAAPDSVVLGALDGRVGPVSVAGDATVDLTAARPQVTGDLRLAPTLDVAALLPATTAADDPVLVGPLIGTPLAVVPAGGDGGLRGVDVDIRLSVPSVRWKRLRLDDAHARVTLDDGLLTLDRLDGGLFGGRLAASGRYDSRRTPETALDLKIENADFAQAPAGDGAVEIVAGRVDLQSRVTGKGRTAQQLLATLSGDGRLTARDGGLSGIDLRAIVDGLKNLARLRDPSELIHAAIGGGRTSFGVLDAPFRIDRGTLLTETARLEAPEGTITASGRADLARRTLDMRVGVDLREPKEAVPFAFRLSGSMDQPAVRLDAADLLAVVRRFGLERLLDSDALGKPAGQLDKLVPGAGRRAIEQLLKGLGN